ncbi:uncharacterized protein LOC132381740 [Hypanus sabinus]|uniref:uncharacterized protein LOC132381740 n=1 Tax=Hypanus sabinus TaxID=79690 RepID=UPI0028C4BDB8|nr:uncharacterized protein LOC132381740 [Hypanus sabinus]
MEASGALGQYLKSLGIKVKHFRIDPVRRRRGAGNPESPCPKLRGLPRGASASRRAESRAKRRSGPAALYARLPALVLRLARHKDQTSSRRIVASIFLRAYQHWDKLQPSGLLCVHKRILVPIESTSPDQPSRWKASVSVHRTAGVNRRGAVSARGSEAKPNSSDVSRRQRGLGRSEVVMVTGLLGPRAPEATFSSSTALSVDFDSDTHVPALRVKQHLNAALGGGREERCPALLGRTVEFGLRCPAASSQGFCPCEEVAASSTAALRLLRLPCTSCLRALRRFDELRLRLWAYSGCPGIWAYGHSLEKKTSSGLVFGNSLHALPQYRLPDGSGTIPRFLMEACTFLGQYLETEGIFRKSGSAARMRNLKAKLQRGDRSLEFSSASDVAGLLKQFFRELLEPIIPAGFHGPLCQAQELQAEDDRSAVTLLLTCLMPVANVAAMKYFLSFLQNVASRSEKNKMGVHNLAVVFAPNLFHLFDANSKLAGSVEKALPLLTQATEILIGQAQNIGRLPPSVLNKLPSLDAEAGFMTTGDPEGRKFSAKQRKRLRQSVRVIVSGALSRLKTSITLQPNRYTVSRQETSPVVGASLTTKRKAADDSARIPGISLKKRRSLSNSEEANPESRVDGGNPGWTYYTRADLSQDDSLCPAAYQSPSVLLKTRTERDILPAGGRRAPSISSATSMGKSKAMSYRRQRIPLRKAAAPSIVDHWESVRGSPWCRGLSGGEDSNNPTSNVLYRDWMTPTLSADVGGSSSCGTRLLSTLLMQGNDPQECDLPCQEPPQSLGLVSAGTELSAGEADTADAITNPRDASLKAKARAVRPRSVLRPSVADRPGAVRKDESWTGCKDAVKTDFSPTHDYAASLPCFLQCNSTLGRKEIRRSLSLPEGISDNWEHGVGFGDGPALQLKDLEGTLPAARAENPPAFICGPLRLAPAVETRHRSTDLAGLTTDPLLSQGPATSVIAQVKSSAPRALYNTPYDTPDCGCKKSHPQPSMMELARASVAGCIRKFSKLSVKRDGLKQKLPVTSKQAPQQSSALRFAQRASTLFGRKPMGQEHQGTQRPMRRSLSLESAL